MKRVIHRTKYLGLLVLFYQSLLAFSFGQEDEVKFKYFDGNGNTYVIQENKVEYKPVKQSESSSGTYDGGDPVTKEIASDDFNALKFMIQEIISDKSFHVKNRVKGSGVIKIYDDDNVNKYIISAKSGELSNLEKKLKEIIK